MKAEQERLCAVLKDTISLLCKNSLSYEKQVVVQGLIAITVDKEDVVVIQVNDHMGQPSYDPCVACGHAEQKPPEETSQNARRTRKRVASSETCASPSKITKSPPDEKWEEQQSEEEQEEELTHTDSASLVKAEAESDDEDLIMLDAEIKMESSRVDNSAETSGDAAYISGYIDNSHVASVTQQSYQQPSTWPSTPQYNNTPPQVSAVKELCKQIVKGEVSIQMLYNSETTCSLCGLTLKNADAVKQHALEIHHDPRYQPYQCPWETCNRMFSFTGSVTRHLRVHLDSRPIKCPLCFYRCRNHSSLKCHMKNEHPDRQPFVPTE